VVAASRRVRPDLSLVDRAADRAFFATAALACLASAAATVHWCLTMPPLCGVTEERWTPSMAWRRLPGQSWGQAAGAFLLMWAAMSVAMMLPVLLPMLRRYRQAVRPCGGRLGWLTLMAAVGYFGPWLALGLAVYPLGVAAAAGATQSPAVAAAVPAATGLVLLLAGALQLSRWKARRLQACRWACVVPPSARAGIAWRHGLRLGLDCCLCCAGLTAVLLVAGVMDLAAMALVALAIVAERLAPRGRRIAQATGAVLAGAGCYVLAAALAA